MGLMQYVEFHCLKQLNHLFNNNLGYMNEQASFAIIDESIQKFTLIRILEQICQKWSTAASHRNSNSLTGKLTPKLDKDVVYQNFLCTSDVLNNVSVLFTSCSQNDEVFMISLNLNISKS